MKIILIEDEAIAMRMLRKLITGIDNQTQFIAELESVADAKKWFQKNKDLDVDLIFSDIQLSDGLSFEIFESLQLEYPIVFTTAYNEYAIRAFKVNGLDYLLKPIKENEIAVALQKFKQSKNKYSSRQLVELQQLIQSFQPASLALKPTFLAYQKDKIIPVQSANIAWLNTQNQIVTAVMNNNQKLHIDETMDVIEKRLPVADFFRINRQFIISRNAVIEAQVYFNNRLSLKHIPPCPETVIVSRERVAFFRNWLQGIL